MSELVLLRESSSRINGDRSVNVRIVKASEVDITKYCFLRNIPDTAFEEWVPVEELEVYQTALRSSLPPEDPRGHGDSN